jgi:hypothetical protein
MATRRRVRTRELPESEGLTTIERRGRREIEQSQIGPVGEGVGTTESKNTEGTEESMKLMERHKNRLFLAFISGSG